MENKMWTKTIKTQFRKSTVDVQVWLSDSIEDNKEKVTIQSMMNEYYLIDEIIFSSRDAAYDFIKNYTVAMANSFIVRTAYEAGAVE